MFRTLREWFDYKDEPTGETAEWYAKILDCLDRIEAGEASIDDKPAKSALIWCAVNFISTLDDELEDEMSIWNAQSYVNLIFMVIRHMSLLTYREILDLFPVLITDEDGYREFDGKDIYYDEECFDFSSPSLDSLCLITLCSCGIYFGEETMGTTNFDEEIGDGVMKFISNNYNPTLSKFHCTSVYANYSLWHAMATA